MGTYLYNVHMQRQEHSAALLAGEAPHDGIAGTMAGVPHGEQAMPRRKVVEPLGARLERLRRERGLTQAELARLVDMAQPNISDYERGMYVPTATTIIRLAQVLGVSTDTLLGLEPVKNDTAGLDRAVLRRVRKLEDLSQRDRQAVLRHIDALVERGQAGAPRRVRSG